MSSASSPSSSSVIREEEAGSRDGKDFTDAMRRGCFEFKMLAGGTSKSDTASAEAPSLDRSVFPWFVVGRHVREERKLGHRFGLEGSRTGWMGEVVLE